jgi:hypothetical protein
MVFYRPRVWAVLICKIIVNKSLYWHFHSFYYSLSIARWWKGFTFILSKTVYEYTIDAKSFVNRRVNLSYCVSSKFCNVKILTILFNYLIVIRCMLTLWEFRKSYFRKYFRTHKSPVCFFVCLFLCVCCFFGHSQTFSDVKIFTYTVLISISLNKYIVKSYV